MPSIKSLTRGGSSQSSATGISGPSGRAAWIVSLGCFLLEARAALRAGQAGETAIAFAASALGIKVSA
jgi:hypothetical protein